MDSILQSEAIDKLPVSELRETLETFLGPVLRQLLEKRLREVGRLFVQGILGSQSPPVTQMTRAMAREDKKVWPTAKLS